MRSTAKSRPCLACGAWRGPARCRLARQPQGIYSFEVVGEPPLNEGARPTADYQIVSASYFPTLDLPIVTGRAFSDGDTADTVPIAIVNEAFARRHLPGRSPIGLRVAYRPASTTQATPVRARSLVLHARSRPGLMRPRTWFKFTSR